MADFRTLYARQDPGSTASDSTTDSTTQPTPPPTSPPPESSSTTPPPESTPTTPPPDSSSSSSSPPPPESSSSDSSAPPPQSSTTTLPPSSTTTQSTTTQTSTIIGTDANGSQYTSIVTQTVVSTPTIAVSDRSTTSSSNTGAIVGGVVGGIAGAAIIATLIFFFCRRRRQRDEFDGNFDPDRVVGLSGDNRATLPDIDLAADNITPYNYTPAGVGMPVPQHVTGSSMSHAPMPAGGAPDMRQYGGQVPAFLAGGLAGGAAGAAMAHGGRDGAVSPPSAYSHSQPTQSQYAPSASDHGGYPDYAAYAAYANQNQNPQYGPSSNTSPTTASFGPQVAAVPGRDFRHPSPGPSLAHTSYTGQTDPSVSGSSSGPGVIPSAKEREAMANRRSGNLAVANPDGANQGPSGVLQHQDGGRLDSTPEDEEPSEVPPRYDTIPHDR